MFKKIFIIAVIFFGLISVSTAQENNAKKFAGVWKGILDLQGQSFSVIFTFAEKEGKLSGTAESPEMGGGATTIDNIVVTGTKIQFEIAAARAGFEGTLKEEKKIIDGTLIMQEQGYPLVLTKDDKAVPAEEKKIDTVWEGALSVQGTTIPLVFKTYTKPDGTIGGLLDSPSQNTVNIPASSASLTADELKFEISAIGASYTGKIDKATMTAKGTFSQAGQEFPLDLKKAEKK